MVLFDSSVLSLLLHPDAEVPNDPATDKPIARAQDRIDFLRQRLEDDGIRILIPAPVLSEFLTFADAEYLSQITQTMWFEIGSFDQRAAVEAAIALRRALKRGVGKRHGLPSPWQKIKVDRQIVAIGKVYGVTHVYSTDSDVLTLARESGLQAIHAADLPLPPREEIQLTLEEFAASQRSSLPITDSEQVPKKSADVGSSSPEPAPGEDAQARPAPEQSESRPASRKKPPSAE